MRKKSRSISEFLATFDGEKLSQIFKSFTKKWYYLWITSFALLILIYLFYFLFAYTRNVPDLSLVPAYPTAPNPTDFVLPSSFINAQNIYFSQLRNYYGALESAYRTMSGSGNTIGLVSTIAIIVLLLLAYTVSRVLKRDQSWPLYIGIVLILGIVIRMGYGFYTDAIVTRQHDVWHSLGYGHYGIIVSIYENNAIPSIPLKLVDGSLVPNIEMAYQMYHPKFSHYILAYFMKFNSLFMGGNIWTLYQANRILLIWTMVMSLLFANEIFKDLKLSDKARLPALMIVSFSPIFFRLSAMTNNDNMMIFFMFLALMLAVKFFKKPNVFTSIGLALSIGLSMGSKLSGALVAIPIGMILLLKFLFVIEESNEKNNYRSLFYFAMYILIFAIIVFPVGLYWPIYNLRNYNQPLNYVFEVTNTNLFVDEAHMGLIDRFLSLPIYEFIKSPFVMLWKSSAVGQDYNIYSTLLKSSAFGEFSSNFFIGAILLYVSTLLVFIGFIISIIYYIFQSIRHRHFYSLTSIASGLIIMLVFFLSYAYFNYQFPATCTMDFRYLVPLILGLGIYIGGFVNAQKPHSNNRIDVSYLIIIAVLSFYGFSSLLYYTFLPTI
ncbi:MAG TPA: glycosyltransferase family 39 protein [Bacilli bacterium]|nr:glycosyltransferase family 39 protein [Bacilli bacterium]